MSSCKQKGGSLASKRVMTHVNGNIGDVVQQCRTQASDGSVGISR